jgi:hypothetical protein
MSTEFAISLVRQNILTAEQFLELVEAAQSDQLPLSAVALRANRLTVHQVHRILAIRDRDCKPFSEIALECGYLSEPQLNQLRIMQIQTRPLLREKIVDLGLLTANEVRGLYHGFVARREAIEVQRQRPRPPKFKAASKTGWQTSRLAKR